MAIKPLSASDPTLQPAHQTLCPGTLSWAALLPAPRGPRAAWTRPQAMGGRASRPTGK